VDDRVLAVAGRAQGRDRSGRQGGGLRGLDDPAGFAPAMKIIRRGARVRDQSTNSFVLIVPRASSVNTRYPCSKSQLFRLMPRRKL
jgi:hypothetical protein